MSSKTPTQDRSLQTWTKITDAAVTLLAKEGMSALTHRRLARDAGVSVASTTSYFEKKADIVAAVSQLLVQRYQARCERA